MTLTGVNHGDLYGHNILYSEAGEVLLGDFGAASFIDEKEGQNQKLEKLEVRAFGILLEEIINVMEMRDETMKKELGDLKEKCITTELSQRPSFVQIEQTLSQIKLEKGG